MPNRLGFAVTCALQLYLLKLGLRFTRISRGALVKTQYVFRILAGLEWGGFELRPSRMQQNGCVPNLLQGNRELLPKPKRGYVLQKGFTVNIIAAAPLKLTLLRRNKSEELRRMSPPGASRLPRAS